MFPSCPLDESYISPDNCSSGRNNASRFPIGITSLGDENHQIRIQSAVHKYNNSASYSLNSKCNVISPARNSFLKNSLKSKNYEGDAEGTSKSEKKNGNQYEGVGAFPTIHLRKSAVRYRPIRKFNDVKIPYPELPVNRFLSSSSELCPDLKSSTRSVLDVLEDLSGKKIHIKENNGNNKPKSKGLGGDYVINSNAVYKPLFVQKPKISSVLTKDNTTQTLSPFYAESPSSQSSNSFIRNNVSDPKAELRRKLAKQNNEIFASLSSSITSSFALKRKIEKVLSDRGDENLTNGSATKKSKISDQSKNYDENGVSNSLGWSKTSSISSMKLNKKNKRKETNSPASPNKDRLTTIFLDMQCNHAESQLFRSMPSSVETKSAENLQTSMINGLESKAASSVVYGCSGSNANEIAKDESALKNSSSLGLTEKITVLDSRNQENEQSNNPIFNFHNSKAEIIPNANLKSTSATLQLDINTSSTPKFSFPKSSEVNQIKNGSRLNGTMQNTSNGSNSEKKDSDNLHLNKSLTSGSSNDKSNFSSFKFGAGKHVSPELSVSRKELKTPTSEALSERAPISSNSALQFSFGTTTNDTFVVASQTSTVKFGSANTHDSSTSPIKALFSFGNNTSSNQQSCETNKIEEKDKISNGVSSLIVVTTQPPGAFNFAQKSSMDSPPKTVAATTSPTSQSNAISFSPSTTSLSTNKSFTVESSKSEFTFGDETEPRGTSTSKVSATQEQKFSFTFGQKSDIDQNKVQELCEQKNSNLFSFGQKSTTQESTENLPSQNLPVSSQPTPIFGHNLPVSVASTAPVTFGQTSPPQISDGFGAKPEAQSLTNVSETAFGKNTTAFPVKTPVFGSSASDFGNATTQASIGSKTSTSNASGFGFGASVTTRPTATFGVSSASPTAPGFGVSVTSQSKSGFGSSSTTPSTTAFGSSPITQSTSAFEASPSDSTFRVSATTRPSFEEKSAPQSIYSFGISTASQSLSSFGVSSTTQPASMFGTSTSHSTSCFGAPSTQSTHTFGTTAGFKVSSSSQPASIFGAPTSSSSAVKFGPTTTTQTNSSFGATSGFSTASSTQPNTSFGAPVVTATSIFGTTHSSFSQTFGNKPTSSLGQTANIFEQNTASSFTSSNTFNSNQNNIFVSKPPAEGRIFDQNKTQTTAFGSATQPFAAPSKFSFGMSTSNVTGFTTSSSTTTTPAFSFGGSTTQNTFTFGSNTSGSNNSFAFKSEPFKFGTTTTKEGSGFGGSNTPTFTFGGGQLSNNSTTESKPTFNFGSTQVSSSAPFNFGTAPSPVFSFGSCSAGSGSNFSFGTPTPTPGVSFGHTSTPSPAAPFAVPGTFCIGSGSSQSRPRATSRPRRRP